MLAIISHAIYTPSHYFMNLFNNEYAPAKRFAAMRTLLFFSFLALCSTSVVFGQNVNPPCGTDQVVEAAFKANPQLRENYRKLQAITKETVEKNALLKAMGSSPGGDMRIIPVVFHIIHNYGRENISDAQIQSCINQLNLDFQKRQPDTTQVAPAFQSIIGQTNFDFRLAQLDPAGNCTNGITRTASMLTYSADEQVKNLANWDTRKYLNVWVVARIASGAGGYAYYPGTAPSQRQEGIVVLHTQTGTLGTSGGGLFASRTMPHEVGHYFNLPHTWGSTNTPGDADNCFADDGVADTPNTIGITGQVCNKNFTSCGGILANAENTMDYGSCPRMFTIGQAERMRISAENSFGARNSLWTQANLAATGVLNTGTALCAPQVTFGLSTASLICPGGSVRFSPNINRAPLDTSLKLQWSFPGARVDSSILMYPTVFYPNSGSFSARLIARNQSGADTFDIANAVTVRSNEITYVPGQVEDFEGATFPQVGSSLFNNWILEGTNGWRLRDVATASGTKTLQIYAAGQPAGVPLGAISARFDLSTVSNRAQLVYKYAAARRNSTNNDVFKVLSTTNCTRSFALRIIRQISGPGALNVYTTTRFVNSSFVPTAADWRTEYIPIAALAGQADVRFKFELTPGGGNNFYIDSLSVVDPPLVTAIESSAPVGSIRLSPNPAINRTDVSLPAAAAFTYYLRDIVSKVQAQGSGKGAGFSLDLSALPAGTYVLSVAQGDKAYTQRLVKEGQR